MKRTAVAVIAIALFSTGVASAQVKAQAISPNPAVQITPVNPALESLESARRITREEAIKLVKEKKAVYVDVRAKNDFDTEHIKGAINIPLGELATHFNKLPANKFLITYCA
ncbi:MAG: rhodanese-like domain-containing protein [Thermoanaerobaculia bacterium]